MTSETSVPQSTETPFAALRDAQFLSLTTFRKSGAEVATPIWFAPAGGKLYAATTGHSGKVKRLRNNSRVRIAPCTQRGEITGPDIDAVARVLPPAEEAVAQRALRRRGPLMARMGQLFYRLRGWENLYLEIAPA